MKKVLLIVNLIVSCFVYAENDNIQIHIESTVITNLNGTAVFNGTIKAIDSLTLLSDFTFQLDYLDSVLVTQTGGGSFLLPGDSANFQFTIFYDSLNLPVYPMEQLIFKNIVLNNGDTLNVEFWVHLFFAPWNELEIFSHSDFKHCGRRWKSPSNDSIAGRVFISKGTIPTSTWIEPDSNSAEWEFVPQYTTLNNLPYYVMLAPVHPDTLQYISDYFGDSTIVQNSSDPSAFIIGPRFTGTIKGRLFARMQNDLGIIIDTMPLSGLLVELKESDMGDLYRIQLAETHTDANGFFSLHYDTHQPFEGGSIELFLHITSKNKNYNLKVVDPLITGWTFYSGVAEEEIINIADQPEGDVGIVDIGSFRIRNEAMHVCHWAENAYRYANSNNMDVTTSDIDPLVILVNSNGSLTLPNSVTWLSHLFIVNHLAFNPTIRLDRIASRHEGTIYHEWGHFFMWKIQGRNFITRLEDDVCLGKEWGSHAWEEEEHIRMAWTEGFANAIHFILDGVYWKEDNEYGYRDSRVGNPIRNGRNQNRLEMRNVLGLINNGLRSEYNMACAIYDLWDGPNKGLPDATLGQSMPGEPLLHPYNDRRLDNTGGNWTEPDDISLNFEILMKPLKDNGGMTGNIRNIYEYYDYLQNTILVSNCELRQKVGQCMRENRVLININTFENVRINGNSLGTWKDNNVSLTSDMILEFSDFINDGKTILCVPISDFIAYPHNPIEETANHITNFPHVSWSNSDFLSEFISDDLRLGFNFPNTQSTFNINAGTSTKSGGVNMNSCGNVVWQFGNTLVKIGSHSSPTAQVHFNAGSQFITGSNTVIHISDNSKLTIEEGATLQIAAGTQIILDGSNSILEIKGTLILEPGASLAPQAGTNGLGFVRFNMGGISNASQAKSRIQMGTGSKIEFAGTSSTQKLLEVTDHVLWLDNNNDNSKTFTIDNGKIEMGENAVLNLGLRSIFNEAHIEPIGGTTDFKGVYLWGHRNTINNLQIKDCRNGLKCTNIVGGYPLLANGLVLDNCTNSLWVEGKGMVLKNANIKNGNSLFGINVTGADLPSVLQTTTIINVTDGVLFKGNKTAALSVTGSTISVAINGIDYKAPGTMFSRCSNYFGNDAGTGIKVAAGSLELANAFGRTAGGNRFFNTSTGTAFNKSIELLLAPIYLHNGINDLKFFGGSGNYALFGRTKDVVIGGNMNASQNFWALPPNSTPTPFVNFLLFDKKIGPTQIVNVPSSSPFTIQSNFDAALATFCSNPTSSGGSGGTGNALITNPRNITWQSPNQNVKDVFEEILTNQYDTLYSSNIIPDWQSALTAAEWNVNMLPIDWSYIDLGITKMNEIAALYLNTDTTFLDQPDTTNTYLSSLSIVLNFWKTRSDTSSSAEGQLVSQHIKFSKAGIYTLTNHYAKAMEIYTDLATTGDSSLFPLASYWLCQLYRMSEIKNAGTDYLFADSLAECDVSYPENYPEPFKEDVLIKGFSKPQMVVYPNPTNKIVNIQLTESTSANLIIFNSLGQLVLEKQLSKSDKWSVDISTLPKGIYSIKIYMNENNATLIQKLIVD